MPGETNHGRRGAPAAGARLAYGATMQLLLPALLARQWWRGRRLSEFRGHLGERLGRYPGAPLAPPASGADPTRIWVHAVSLGETQASLPLLKALLTRWPGLELVLSHMTPTGRAAGAGFALPGLHQAYLPYDAPGAMGRFLDHFRPQLGLVMETEVWPGLVQAALVRDCPLLLVNARLSAGSQRGYARLAGFARAVFGGLTATGAQTPADAERLAALGADPVTVTGNLKFDVEAGSGEQALATRFRAWWGARPTWLAASTREGEETLVLDAQAQAGGNALLVLVPRHPQRFDEVAALLDARGLRWCRRSDGRSVASDCQVVLGDSMGELGAYYRSVELAFVGGSLLPLGGQNLLEACARTCPVLIGPHTFNFTQASEQAVDCGAAQRVADAAELGRVVSRLLADPLQRQTMGQAGLAFIARHRGATGRTLALIESAWRERRQRLE